MLESVGTLLGSCSTPLWLAKIPVNSPVAQTANIPEPVAWGISAPQFFMALIAGVLIAFAIQFLLTNFTVAAGISSEGKPLDLDSNDSWSDAVRSFESKVGIWTLLTVNIAIFIACFLAVKLTVVSSLTLGAIVGVVIWSAYFLLLLLASSTLMGSLVGSAIDTASSGMQGVMATIGATLAPKAANAQIVNTVEASVAAIRRELSAGVDPTRLQESLQDYLADLPIPKLDFKKIGNDFQNLLTSSELRSLTDSDLLKKVNRQTFVDLISQNADLSKQEVNRMADQLENAWQQVLGLQSQNDPQLKLLNFLESASPDELTSDQLNDKLEALVGASSGRSQGSQGDGIMEQTLKLGVSALVGRVLSRKDLSDLDVEKFWQQLQQFKDQSKTISSQVIDRFSGHSFNTIEADVENYLLNSQPWHLNRETLKQEFKDVIYDSQAAPKAVRQQLERLNRDNFQNILESRDLFTSEQTAEIADQLEQIRQEVLETVQAAESQEYSQDLRRRVENYLSSTAKEELNPEAIKRDFYPLLEDREVASDKLLDRLAQFDRNTLIDLLSQRGDLSQEEIEQLVNQLESTRDRVLSSAQERQDQAKVKADELRQQVQDYLGKINAEGLDLDAIEQELQTLLNDPQAGFNALRERLSQFDRDTLVQLLHQRSDLSEEQINQIIDRFAEVRDNILNAPQELVGNAKEQYERITSQIAEYLRNTNLDELDPEGIQQDLAKLLDDPKQGALALRERLSQVDRSTLVKLLSQREDLSEEQVNHFIDRVQDGIRTITKAPRRLTSRAKDRLEDVRTNFEEYLRNTKKEELNPEGIKRDLQQLLNDPQQGWKSVSDRLAQFDRDTLISLLSQREDISLEEANRIVDNIESVRHQLVEQYMAIQRQMQSVMDSVFGKIRKYLNSLERPELNYEGMKRDFRKLFDDPESGWEALRDRFSQFDRDTLVAILSSREDISASDADRIIEQIEGVRDSVLHRAERLQEEAQKRITQLKHKASEQMAQTRKVAATAAWWLFGTAITSVATAAFAGGLAVGGLL